MARNMLPRTESALRKTAIVGLLLLCECGARTESECSVEIASAPSVSTQFQFPSPVDGAIVQDDHGQEWRVRKLGTFTAPANDKPAENTSSATASNDTNLSDAELAERRRPLLLTINADGEAWEYEGLHPNPDRIALGRAKQQAGIRMRMKPDGTIEEGVTFSANTPTTPIIGDSAFIGDTFGAASTFHTSEPDDLFQARKSRAEFGIFSRANVAPHDWNPQTVFASDDRQWVTPTTRNSSTAYRAQVSLTGGFCSATMIGVYTAISAAHCFWQLPSEGGPAPNGAWYNSVHTWAAGFVSRTKWVGGFPFVEDTTASFPSNGVRQSGCFSVLIPNGFISTLGAISEDFAIIDFHGAGCNLNPGSVTGWIAPGIGTAGDHNLAKSWMAAYDTQAVTTPNPTADGWTYNIPTLLERYYPIPYSAVYLSSSELISSVVDLTRGSSGGGLLQQIFIGVGDPTWYWVGPTAREFGDHNSWRNLDWNLWLYIRDHAAEFR